MPKVVLFDLGNVVINYSLQKTVENWSKSSGIPAEVILSKFDFNDDTFHRFERGEITPSRFKKYISGRIGYEFSDAEFEQGFDAMFTGLMPEIENVMTSLRNGSYRVAALSNTNEIHERFVLKKYNRALSCFDKLFLSHRIRSRKPERAAFDTVIDYFKVSPSDILFFDDNPENVGMASSFGIKSTLVNSITDIKNGLENAGITV
ncbi:MAG: HAD family phosphatase [Brevinematales bacterium]|jgi:putative hydrolase of the HAD superfamily